jgi:hypothetical protein
MKVPFTCPSCGAAGSVNAAYAGKLVRCKHCGGRSAVPKPGEPEAEVYALDEPAPETTGGMAETTAEESVFVSCGRDDRTTARRPRRPVRAAPRPSTRKRDDDRAWRGWLIGCGAAVALALATVYLLAPQGPLIAGAVVIAIGSAMLMTGFLVGAYAAFGEDFLYGFLYLVIPLYTAYYLLTRWDDMWVWCTCSTVGVGLILLGTEMVRWAGVGVA